MTFPCAIQCTSVMFNSALSDFLPNEIYSIIENLSLQSTSSILNGPYYTLLLNQIIQL